MPFEEQNRSIYVGDLCSTTKVSTLHRIFGKYGRIDSVELHHKIRDSIVKCYAFITFKSHEDAQRAKEALNNSNIYGTQIRVLWRTSDMSTIRNRANNVYVDNLGPNVNQKELYEIFSRFGEIISCKIKVDCHGGSGGSAFIGFADVERAKKCIKEMNNTRVGDQIVYVGPFLPASEFRNNLYIRNMADGMTDEMLKDLFENFGEILSTSVNENEKGHFGFVCFKNPEAAKRALEEMNGKEINGQPLYVNWAQKKKEREEIFRQRRLFQNSELTNSEKRTIFVKNLKKDEDESTLRSAFSACGTITSATVVLDKRGVSRGFGFVSFSIPTEAEAALKCNNLTLRDRKWSVTMAKSKAELDAERRQQQQNSAAGPGYISTATPMPLWHSPPPPPPPPPPPLSYCPPNYTQNPINLPQPTFSQFGNSSSFNVMPQQETAIRCGYIPTPLHSVPSGRIL